ncbi:glycosyltransferase [Pelagicoccus sp. SDUM812002]|uniref:glycosyltransferase n=1 Tax=Pelagicoccus sp. SDUM812002 TaxID=3041266 RepID=UPI00280ECF25|nr:glycosyltransferase [Pelagicoccus sp. SDUM812002]MDQ8186430.1 glycosyltransferase [Pelagicoccus sp. SDUM812002]
MCVLVVARDAAETIERCLRSALSQGCEVLMVDDCSQDDTVDAAIRAGLSVSSIVQLENHVSLGYARQRGLERVETEYTMLLDADDVLCAGRVERFGTIFQRGQIDAIADELELRDGGDGSLIKKMRIPSYLKTGKDLCRLFERNYLPGIGQIGFRTSVFREIGYDESLTGPEDSDIVLRALLAGARFELVREIGYKMYHYSGSVSRNLDRQNCELARALQKHAYGDVENLFSRSGYSDRVIAWSMYGLANFRGDWEKAVEYLELAFPVGSNRDEVLEPEGPEAVPEGWRLNFARGVISYMQGNPEYARERWERAGKFGATAEVANNLGVSMRLLGQERAAMELFSEALRLSPNFYDARINLGDSLSQRVTLRPLRRDPGRSNYA